MKKEITYMVWYTVEEDGIQTVACKEIPVENKVDYMNWLKSLDFLPTEAELTDYETFRGMSIDEYIAQNEDNH